MKTPITLNQFLSINIFIVLMSFSGMMNAQSGVEILTDGLILPSVDSLVIAGPVLGQLIFDSNTDEIRYYDGTKWQCIGGPYEINLYL